MPGFVDADPPGEVGPLADWDAKYAAMPHSPLLDAGSTGEITFTAPTTPYTALLMFNRAKFSYYAPDFWDELQVPSALPEDDRSNPSDGGGIPNDGGNGGLGWGDMPWGSSPWGGDGNGGGDGGDGGNGGGFPDGTWGGGTWGGGTWGTATGSHTATAGFSGSGDLAADAEITDGNSGSATVRLTGNGGLAATTTRPKITGGNVRVIGSGSLSASGFPGGTGGVNPTLTSRVVGIPTTNSVNVAVRTKSATTVRLKVGTDPAVTQSVVFGAAVTPNAQGDSQLTATGLTTSTRQFYYRIGMTVNGVETFDSGPVGSFKTAPTGATSFAFNFGSCTNGSDSASMAAMATRKDDLFFHLGDLYYADGTGTSVSNIRAKYAAKLQAANHAALFSTTPSAYTPSDHDAMNNNGTAGSDPTAWTNWNTVYREMWAKPSTIPATTGVYHTFVWGRVRFIVLDDRSFKSDPAATDNSSKTALGATQKQWLKTTITNATEPAIVIAQSAPWQGTSAGDDGWAGYTTERTELANFFVASGKKIVMLGGDMHAVAASNSSLAPGGVTLFQAAPFNNSASIKYPPYTVGPYPATAGATVQQYGRVVVTDTGSQITLAFTGYSSDNTARVTLSTSVTG